MGEKGKKCLPWCSLLFCVRRQRQVLVDTGPGVGAWREKSPFYQWGWAKRGLAVDGAQSRPLRRGTSGQEAGAHDVIALGLPSLQASTAGSPGHLLSPGNPCSGMTHLPSAPSALLHAFGLPSWGLLISVLMQQLERPPPQPTSLPAVLPAPACPKIKDTDALPCEPSMRAGRGGQAKQGTQL